MKKILTLAFAGATPLAVASPAMAANVTIDWQKPSETTSQINVGESVVWNVVEGGHNVDVLSGPETFKSTNKEDPKGTQFSHVFTKAGTYQFICDYHSHMSGTITVVAPPPPNTGGGSTGGGGTTGGGSTGGGSTGGGTTGGGSTSGGGKTTGG